MAPDTLSVGERLYRARRIGTTFGRVYLGLRAHRMMARRLQPPDMEARWAAFHRDAARRVYDAAVELQGLILKGCQFLGSRADVLPAEAVEVLSALQDRVPPRPFSTVRSVVETELGRPLESVFDLFGERPIASASLAQVHEARRKDGTRVAVKVQYPEIAARVHSDLANLRALFRAVGVLERDLDLMPLVEELGVQVPYELDFEREGRTAERVASFFAHRGDVAVPGIHWDLTRRRVLVMDYVWGIKVSDAPALRAAGVDTDRLMQTLVEAYCEQILGHGVFHADPHPGNLLVQPGRGPDGGPRLVFLDFGLAKELPADFRARIVTFARALLTGDAPGMGRALVDLGFETRRGGPEALETIAHALLDVAVALRHRASLDPEAVRRAGAEIPRLVRENPVVRIPSHLVLVGRVVGLLSGLGRTLDARVDMVRTVLPYALGTAGGSEPARPSA